MHFRHISAKIQPKILHLFIILSYQCATFRLEGPLGPPLATPLLLGYVHLGRLITMIFLKYGFELMSHCM